MPKNVLKLHIEEASKAVETANSFYELAKKNPSRKKELLEAVRLCISRAKAQVVLAKLYKK